jgi:hypothetical protein
MLMLRAIERIEEATACGCGQRGKATISVPQLFFRDKFANHDQRHCSG